MNSTTFTIKINPELNESGLDTVSNTLKKQLSNIKFNIDADFFINHNNNNRGK